MRPIRTMCAWSRPPDAREKTPFPRDCQSDRSGATGGVSMTV